MIWNRLPKGTFVGATVLELGVYDAVAHFSMGSGAAKNILLEGGLDPGSYFEQRIWRADKKRVKRADKKRVKKADHRATPEAKKRRKVLRGQKKKEDQNKEAEGKTYEAGAF